MQYARLQSTFRRPLIALVLTGLCSWLLGACRPPLPSYEGYGYLIIAPEAVLPSVTDFADYKESRGWIVDVVSLEDILSTTPGEDDPEKIRNYLKGYSTLTAQREFVLLVGSMDGVPMRVAYPNPLDHVWSDVPTDFYYEELTGDWDSDGDGFYGEYGEDMTPATEDYHAELYVGRIPWDLPEQIESMLHGMILYGEDTSARMKRALGAAATISTPCDAAAWLEQAKHTVLKPAGYDATTLYEDCPGANPDFELSRTRFLGQWSIEEPGLAAWFSHGNPYGSYYAEDPYTFIDVDNMPENVAPAVCLTSGCTVAAPDEESLGREIVREGACAAFLGSSRITFYGLDPVPAFTAQFKISTSLVSDRRAVAEAKILSIEYYADVEEVPDNIDGPSFHQDLFQFMVFGDPSIQLR